jgi:hypothetical protein
MYHWRVELGSDVVIDVSYNQLVESPHEVIQALLRKIGGSGSGGSGLDYKEEYFSFYFGENTTTHSTSNGAGILDLDEADRDDHHIGWMTTNQVADESNGKYDTAGSYSDKDTDPGSLAPGSQDYSHKNGDDEEDKAGREAEKETARREKLLLKSKHGVGRVDATRTASFLQIKKPIYKTRVGTWRRYGSEMQSAGFMVQYKGMIEKLLHGDGSTRVVENESTAEVNVDGTMEPKRGKRDTSLLFPFKEHINWFASEEWVYNMEEV